MELSDFEIGKEFYSPKGKYFCVDIGTKMVIATPLLECPAPVNIYMVFDEHDLKLCRKEP